MSNLDYRVYDLQALGMLPERWIDDIEHMVASYSQEVVTDGSVDTSREPQDALPVPHRIVGGEAIATHCKWLRSLYDTHLLTLASAFVGKRAYAAEHPSHSIFINSLEGIGARYERHVDSNPITGILFVSRLNISDGGLLVFEDKQGQSHSFCSYPGLFYLFEAETKLHYVSPLLTETKRITVPMNFYLTPTKQFTEKFFRKA